MNSSHKTWLFFLLAILAVLPVLSLGESEIEIDGADDFWSAGVETIHSSANNPSGETGDEPLICHADDVWTGVIAAPDNMLLDTTFGGDFDLPADLPLICHADAILNFASLQPNFNEEPENPIEKPEEPKNIFVYVALGDSYQSGEGAGNSILNTQEYLTSAYESGTYTGTLISGDNSCHRSLFNYAKLNRDKLKPGAEVILIDKTCSGAKIEMGDMPSIIGNMIPGQIAPDSQISQVLGELVAQGLSVDDVDLVTVGMGGNDAKFAQIVQACVIPGLIKEALNRYPGAPNGIEEDVALYLGDAGSCEQVEEKMGIASDQFIDSLVEKEIWAQNIILSTFANAQIMQINYPDILPLKNKAPEWCGGIRKSDLDYANKKVLTINQKISEALNAVATVNPRLRLVNIERALGDNALCPAAESSTLANGIKQKLFDKEVDRLLNVNGNGNAKTRELADKIFVRYNEIKSCIRKNFLPFQSCNVGEFKSQLVSAVEEFSNYLLEPDQFKVIMASLTESSDNESIESKYDRSHGLFHPNARGYEIMACNVLAAYNRESANLCLSQPSKAFTCTANGQEVSNKPIHTEAGSDIWLYLDGFKPNSLVEMTMRSNTINLGTAVADASGVVDVIIEMPEASPGVHRIQLKGDTASGIGIIQEIKVNYPGNPGGNDESYGMYLTGFAPNDGMHEIEQVDIIYGGTTFGPFIPDEDGGILIEVPLFNQVGQTSLQVKSQTTNTVIEKIIQVADIEAPQIDIEIPLPAEEKKYLNTDGLLPIKYLITDNSGENITGRIFLDGEEYNNDYINLGRFIESGLHSLVIGAEDSSGNQAIKKIIFDVEPKSLMAFSVKNMQLRVKKSLIKNNAKSENESVDFILSGEFELPEKVKKENLDFGAFLSFSMAGSTSTAKLEFNKKNNIWIYKQDKEQNQILKINNAILYWDSGKNFCTKDEKCLSQLKNKNWFYIRGELMAESKYIPNENIIISLNLPLTPSGETGSLYGEDKKQLSKNGNLLRFDTREQNDKWMSEWWRGWERFVW